LYYFISDVILNIYYPNSLERNSYRGVIYVSQLLFCGVIQSIWFYVGELMKRLHTLALSGLALFLASSTASFAQAVRPGQQCVPAVADASMYGNCRLRIVQGQEVCRCAILPLARRTIRDVTITGSISGSPSSTAPNGGFPDNDRWIKPATGPPAFDRDGTRSPSDSLADNTGRGGNGGGGNTDGESTGGSNAGSGTGNPGAGGPSTGTPGGGTGNPSTGNPGTGNPGTGGPSAGTPGGNNGVGNGPDGSPPGGGNTGNDGPGTGPGNPGGSGTAPGNGGGKGDHGGGHGNNGVGNGGHDGSPNGKDDSSR
jgi:hypothetical protein